RNPDAGNPPTNNPPANGNSGGGGSSNSDYSNLSDTWGLYTREDEKNYSQITLTLNRAGANTWTGQSSTTMHVSEESAKYFLPSLQGDVKIIATGPGTLRINLRREVQVHNGERTERDANGRLKRGENK